MVENELSRDMDSPCSETFKTLLVKTLSNLLVCDLSSECFRTQLDSFNKVKHFLSINHQGMHFLETEENKVKFVSVYCYECEIWKLKFESHRVSKCLIYSMCFLLAILCLSKASLMPI